MASARPSGVRWTETVESAPRARRRYSSSSVVQAERAGQWRVALEMMQGLLGETKCLRKWRGDGGDSNRSTSFPRLSSRTSFHNPAIPPSMRPPFPSLAFRLLSFYFYLSLSLQHISNSSSSSSSSSFVAYAQEQNDCFRSEYSALAPDVESHIPWASEALGCLPEAVNLWIGNHRSQTSFHKDHYENLYAVISGEKHFLLLPPTDLHRMYIHQYPAARYSFHPETGEFTLKLEDPFRYVPWCSVEPFPTSSSMEQRQRSMFPRYFSGPKPFECTVRAGEILYLPSMWFHHVRQSPDGKGRTIAINYWYDMQFDIKYAYFNFLQSIDYHLANPPAKVSEYQEDSEEDDRTDISDVIHDHRHATELKLGSIVQDR